MELSSLLGLLGDRHEPREKLRLQKLWTFVQMRHSSAESRRMLLRPDLHVWTGLRMPRFLRMCQRTEEVSQ